jgi:hypothetical protein
MSRVYKTARGKSLDMASLIARQEQTRAVILMLLTLVVMRLIAMVTS